MSLHIRYHEYFLTLYFSPQFLKLKAALFGYAYFIVACIGGLVKAFVSVSLWSEYHCLKRISHYQWLVTVENLQWMFNELTVHVQVLAEHVL